MTAPNWSLAPESLEWLRQEAERCGMTVPKDNYVSKPRKRKLRIVKAHPKQLSLFKETK